MKTFLEKYDDFMTSKTFKIFAQINRWFFGISVICAALGIVAYVLLGTDIRYMYYSFIPIGIIAIDFTLILVFLVIYSLYISKDSIKNPDKYPSHLREKYGIDTLNEDITSGNSENHLQPKSDFDEIIKEEKEQGWYYERKPN